MLRSVKEECEVLHQFKAGFSDGDSWNAADVYACDDGLHEADGMVTHFIPVKGEFFPATVLS